MPDFTFQIEPIIIRQQDAKGYNFALLHFTDSIQIAAARRQVRNLGRLLVLPESVQVGIKPGFSPSIQRSSFRASYRTAVSVGVN